MLFGCTNLRGAHLLQFEASAEIAHLPPGCSKLQVEFSGWGTNLDHIPSPDMCCAFCQAGVSLSCVIQGVEGSSTGVLLFQSIIQLLSKCTYLSPKVMTVVGKSPEHDHAKEENKRFHLLGRARPIQNASPSFGWQMRVWTAAPASAG